MSKTEITAQIKITKWTGVEFKMHIERNAEITLPVEADHACIERAIEMALGSLKVSGVAALTHPEED